MFLLTPLPGSLFLLFVPCPFLSASSLCHCGRTQAGPALPVLAMSPVSRLATTAVGSRLPHLCLRACLPLGSRLGYLPHPPAWLSEKPPHPHVCPAGLLPFSLSLLLLALPGSVGRDCTLPLLTPKSSASCGSPVPSHPCVQSLCTSYVFFPRNLGRFGFFPGFLFLPPGAKPPGLSRGC